MINYEASVKFNEETMNELAQEGVVVMHEIDDIFRLSKYHEVGLQAFGEAVCEEIECLYIVTELCYGERLSYLVRSDVSHRVLS